MYSNNKKTKIEINDDVTVTVHHLNPIEANKVAIKCITAVTPSLMALADGVISGDRSLTLSTAGQLLIQNLSADDVENVMLKVLGGIQDLEGECIGCDPKAINTWFTYNSDAEMIDVFSTVFEESVVSKIINSKLFKKVMPQMDKIKEALGADEQATTAATEE
jgi:hypothetical protein